MMKRKLQYLIVLLTFLPFVKVQAQLAPPIAGFAYDPGIDTVWLNSPFTFVNTSTYDARNYWRIIPVTGAFNATVASLCNEYGCFIDTTSRAYRFKFENIGTYRVTLVTKNNLGVDSLTKLVYVGLATKKPKANFYIDKYVLGNAEKIQLYDLSQNGATNWEWKLTPACYNCNNPNQPNNQFVNPFSVPADQPDPNVQMPKLYAQEGGRYGICLVASNNIGSDTFCRPNYVEIISGNSINANQAGTLDTLITINEGYLYDNGGPYVNYFNKIQGSQNTFLNGKFYTIAPCASELTLFFEQFKFRTVDTLIIHEISKTSGIVLRKLSGFNLTAAQRTVVSPSGRVVLEWKCADGVQQATDSGFVMRFTSVPANYGPPKALFTCPDVVYSGYNVKYINQSSGQGNLFYEWDADGLDSDVDPFNNTGFESTDRDGVSYTFYNNQMGPVTRRVCLYVANCAGRVVYCKDIEVRPIQTGPVVDFSSPRTSGFTTDIFKLNDQTKNGALTWNWTITPNTFTYVQGTNSTSQNPVVRLNAQGRYTVKLEVSNIITTVNPDFSLTDSTAISSLEKPFYLSVIAYDRPGTEWPISADNDIGISRVRIPGTDLDTTTPLKSPIYDTIFTRKTVKLYRGVDYNIEVSRLTALTPMDRKIWIDTSFDAKFLAPGELILNEINQKTLTGIGKFRLPNNIEVGRVLRMRVGISEGNDALFKSDRATSGCFEDYAIEVGFNDTVPTISLKGDSVFRVQVNKPFNDPGVTAHDDIEGDISTRYEAVTNLDLTKVGFYVKKYFVRDNYNNLSDTVYRVIQVEINQIGPTLSLNSNDTIYVNVKEDTLWKMMAKPTAVDHLGNPMNSALISQYGVVDSSVIGKYTLTWVIKDEFNLRDTIKQVIFVRDIKAPKVETFDMVTRIVKHQIKEPFDSRKALILDDNYYSIDDLTVTRSGSVNENLANSYNISYVVCDPSGNCSAPFFIIVEVKDQIKPEATLLGENPWIIDIYADKQKIIAIDEKIDYSDNAYQKPTLTRVDDYSKVDFNAIGNYTITYLVRDGAGNETILTRYVRVVDRKAPIIKLLGPSTVDLAYQDTFVDEWGVDIKDNYESAAKLKLSLDTSTTLEVVGVPNSKVWVGGKRGYKQIRYNVTDSSGNVANEVIRTINVDFRSGLTDYKTNGELSVYPNPNAGVFTLKTKEALKGSTTATLYNVLGAKVYSETYEAGSVTTHEIATSQLKSGVYLLHVTNNGKQFTQRVVIK